MNKKGYTLVELLAVIVIIALIGGIAVISYSSYQKSTAERVFETYMDNMHESMIMYLLNNTALVPKTTGVKPKVLLKDLPIEQIKNPYNQDDKCLNSGSYVEVEYLASGDLSNSNVGLSGLKYKVCLNCNESSYSKCKEYTN